MPPGFRKNYIIFSAQLLIVWGIDMSISRVEEELGRIKEEFSQIPAVRTAIPETVQKPKGSRPGIILAAVVVIVLALLALVLLLF